MPMLDDASMPDSPIWAAFRLALLQQRVEIQATLESKIGTQLEAIIERQDETNTHLRTLNGRVYKGEVADVEHQTKIRNLEREVFRRRAADREVPEEQRAITKRDLKVVAWTLGAVTGAIAFIEKLWPLLVKLATP